MTSAFAHPKWMAAVKGLHRITPDASLRSGKNRRLERDGCEMPDDPPEGGPPHEPESAADNDGHVFDDVAAMWVIGDDLHR